MEEIERIGTDKSNIASPFAVAGIVEYGDMVLVGQKVKDGSLMSNLWHLPGGKVHPGEGVVDALVREIREESNLDIEVKQEMGEKIEPDGKVVRWYLCNALTDDIKAGSDLIDIKFVPRADVLNWCDQKAIDAWTDEVKEYLGISI